MKIAILDSNTLGYADEVWDGLKQYGEVKIANFGSTNTKQDVIDFLQGEEVLFTNKISIDKEIMDACKDLKYIHVLATGYNIIDTDYAKEKGIIVTNVPSYSTMSVCQTAIGLLLEVCNRIGYHDKTVHDGRWALSKTFSYWDFELTELDGKTFGIIGLGTIGKVVAKVAADFGMKVIAYSPHPSEEGAKVAEYVSLDELFARADVISLHCKLTEETKNLINKDTIAKMKDGVILINTARGQAINEADVAEALKSGKMGGAGIDAVTREPIAADNPLLTAPNCVITPHIGWTTKEARGRLIDITYDNIKNYAEGTPINVVNK